SLRLELGGEAAALPSLLRLRGHPGTPSSHLGCPRNWGRLNSGQGKAAAVISLTNMGSADTWEFADAYLTRDMTSHTKQSFALRMTRSAIAPGQSGTIAVVADKRAFEKNGQLVDLALQIFRSDGNQQVLVRMDRTLVRQ
ncbi:MAG: DUF2381 family protein, partial [Myxococcaceae bacterium]